VERHADHRANARRAIRVQQHGRDALVAVGVLDDVRRVRQHVRHARRPERRDLPASDDTRHATRPIAGDVEDALVHDVRVRAAIDVEVLGEHPRGGLHDLVRIDQGLRGRIEGRKEPVSFAKLAQRLF